MNVAKVFVQNILHSISFSTYPTVIWMLFHMFFNKMIQQLQSRTAEVSTIHERLWFATDFDKMDLEYTLNPCLKSARLTMMTIV